MNKKKVLVTGGAGFIGSHVADTYVDAGYDVTVIDDLSTGRIELVNKNVDFIKVSICDDKIEPIFKKKKFDIVNHHAAQIDVRKSVEKPKYDANINIMGSLNLLENAKNNSCKKFIFISSGGVMYGESKYNKDENEQANPISPYGISKRAIEMYTIFYSKMYGLDYSILRYANVYGPRQNNKGEAGVVAIFSDAMLQKQPVNIFGNGKQIRDYVYVKDIAKANLMAADKGSREIINISTEASTSVNELCEIMSEIYEYYLEPIYKPEREGELIESRLSNLKMRKIIGDFEMTKIKDGLEETAKYYENLYKSKI